MAARMGPCRTRGNPRQWCIGNSGTVVPLYYPVAIANWNCTSAILLFKNYKNIVNRTTLTFYLKDYGDQLDREQQCNQRQSWCTLEKQVYLMIHYNYTLGNLKRGVSRKCMVKLIHHVWGNPGQTALSKLGQDYNSQESVTLTKIDYAGWFL